MTHPPATDVLIVGAGHAGVQLAVTLAKLPRPPSVRLVGDEPGFPYERPPLSKRLLYGNPDGEPAPVPVLLRSAEYWQRSPVDLRTGDRVLGVDPVARQVRTESGAQLGYRTLVWAAGGRAASSGLPGEQLGGVHGIRDLADLAALRTDLAGTRTAVVIGGGYIGLEVAAALRQRGIAVTVVEIAPRLLARVTGPVVSEFFAGLHRRHGVDVRLGVGVARICGPDGVPGGRVTGVRLSDGTELAADVVLVGVGMRPTVGPLLAAGADGDALGVLVDAECRTSLPDVYAIGDCARQLNPWSASAVAMRVESVHNAGQHAVVVARSLVGAPAPEPAPPRFWSTQYGHELRTVGLPSATDEPVLRGDPTGGAFSVGYLRQGRLAAIDTVDRPRDFARAQALIAAGWRPGAGDALADPERDLPRPEPARA